MKVIIKHEDGRKEVAVIDIEGLVPKNHLLRKIDRSVNWNKIYEFVEDLYSPNMGRPSVDPVVLVKMVFLQHLYGLRSLLFLASIIPSGAELNFPSTPAPLLGFHG